MPDPAVARATGAFALDRQIRPADRWGPFADGIDEAERRARLRSMRALCRVLCGPRGVELAAHLGRAEHDPDALPFAVEALDRLPSVDRRHLLTSYAALGRAA